MDLSELERLENPAKVLKLSEVVREHGYQNPSNFRTCVLGTAITAFTGRQPEEWQREQVYSDYAAELFGVPYAVCKQAERMCLRRQSAGEIADWLESKGY